MNTVLEKALTKYAEEYAISPEEAAERILTSFLIAGGYMKKLPEIDEMAMRSGKI